MSGLVDPYGNPLRPEKPKGSAQVSARQLAVLQAAYDAATDGGRNAEHWTMADGLSAAAANNYETRRRIREKARYEYSNNGFAKGLAWTLATDLVGTRLRVQFQNGDKAMDKLYEQRLSRWMKKTKLARKVRTGRVVRMVDGEAFFVRTYSPNQKGRIKTSVRLVECDHFEDPTYSDEKNYVGGIRFDPRDGEPLSYTMLVDHPGDNFAWNDQATEQITADDVFHWFRVERGGQVRAVSEMCSSLSLYAQLRRWTLATLDAAETAASIAAILKTQSMPLDEDGMSDYDRDVEAFDTLRIEHGMLMAAPRGYDLEQMKAEHPTSSFREFRNAVVDESGRSQNAPPGKARGDHSESNYSASQLDDGNYHAFQECERSDFADEGFETFVTWWAGEARLVYPEFSDLDPEEPPEYTLYFDGRPAGDEVKRAKSVTMLVDAELMAKEDYWLSEGLDPEEQREKIRRQREFDAKLNEEFPRQAAIQPTANDKGDDAKDGEEEDDDESQEDSDQ